MAKRTQEEIDKEIAVLESVKERVPRRSFFADDNHATIDAQIDVLKRNLTNDDIYDEWPDDEADFEIRNSALEAMFWRNGEDSDAPSVGWEELAS